MDMGMYGVYQISESSLLWFCRVWIDGRRFVIEACALALLVLAERPALQSAPPHFPFPWPMAHKADPQTLEARGSLSRNLLSRPLGPGHCTPT
eukprot:scaffold214232_cov49-Tisochrysis_lutea.AAC.1